MRVLWSEYDTCHSLTRTRTDHVTFTELHQLLTDEVAKRQLSHKVLIAKVSHVTDTNYSNQR